jgi:hypothetical protein
MEMLLIAVVQTLAPNVIYALPDRRCLLFCDVDRASLQQSTDDVFTLDTHIPLVDGMCEVTGGFIRNVGQADVLVVLKC